MSQVTVLGLCSDNLVTILQPSSTINCISCGNGTYLDVSSNSGTVATHLEIPIAGSAFVSGSVAITGQTTVTIGGASFSGSVTPLPFQTFANGPAVYLDISGSATSYSYTISQLS